MTLFLCTLLSDWAYFVTYEVQWINFAAWLVAGAVVLTGLALLWETVDFLRSDARRDRRGTLYMLVLLATFVTGLVDALIHAKDGWATMPEGLLVSVLVSLFALASVLLGFSTLRAGAAR
jgi:uncharacterized membrane protein